MRIRTHLLVVVFAFVAVFGCAALWWDKAADAQEARQIVEILPPEYIGRVAFLADMQAFVAKEKKPRVCYVERTRTDGYPYIALYQGKLRLIEQGRTPVYEFQQQGMFPLNLDAQGKIVGIEIVSPEYARWYEPVDGVIPNAQDAWVLPIILRKLAKSKK